jgi:hypothetical protein
VSDPLTVWEMTAEEERRYRNAPTAARSKRACGTGRASAGCRTRASAWPQSRRRWASLTGRYACGSPSSMPRDRPGYGTAVVGNGLPRTRPSRWANSLLEEAISTHLHPSWQQPALTQHLTGYPWWLAAVNTMSSSP